MCKRRRKTPCAPIRNLNSTQMLGSRVGVSSLKYGNFLMMRKSKLRTVVLYPNRKYENATSIHCQSEGTVGVSVAFRVP